MKNRAGNTRATVTSTQASASHHQAQAQPWGWLAWWASTTGTTSADSTMPQPTPPYTMPSISPLWRGYQLPSLAASKPPATNTQALAAPASRRCSSKAQASVRNPLEAISRLATSAPPTSTLGTDQRRISAGADSAPSR